LKTERLTLEKLATCKAAPIPTIPEDVLEVGQVRGLGSSMISVPFKHFLSPLLIGQPLPISSHCGFKQ